MTWPIELQRRTTYDQDAPWLTYRYLIPDAFAWALGWCVVRTECAICGEHQHRVIGTWGKSRPNHPARQAWLEQHQHRQLRWQPQYWVMPFANPQAWREWRRLHERRA